MKNLYKITAFLFFSTIFAFEVNADDWAEKDCDEYEQLIGGLVWLSWKRWTCLIKLEKQKKKKKLKNCLKLVLL